MRDLENPSIATEYVGHKAQATVARYSPSGYYMASGDANGNVRIWDTVNEEHILKNECRPISGKISDIAWDCESKRLIAVGEGKESFGHAFLFDTLSSVGEITGHSKMINSVSIRQQRPFRAVTASDDMTVSFFTGVPFKFQKNIRDHTRFVHAVQFSPNGDFFVSAGADGKMFLYDGKTGDKIEELVSEQDGHKGSIFAVSWSPDSTQILSSSSDYTAKIWDVNTKRIVNTFQIDSAVNTVDNQQVGNLWVVDYLITTSLSGEISYLDKNSGKVSRQVDGHAKAITALAVSKKDNTLFTGSYDGRVYGWKFGEEDNTTKARRIAGDGHSNQITAINASSDAEEFFSVAMDDTLRQGSAEEFTFSDKAISTNCVPRSLAISKDKIKVVATDETVLIYDEKLERIGSLENVDFKPSVADISSDGKTVFVGGQDNKVRMYQLDNGKLTASGELDKNLGNITCLAVHPELNLIAVGDSVGKIFVYDIESKDAVIQSWVFHTSRITALDWSDCGTYLVSGSIDTHIYIWNRDKPSRKIAIKNAHVDAVNSVRFLHNTTELNVVSVGQDAAVRVWEGKF
ncbi:quinon protein alcohol dehydrogenase-like superfamily [Mycotypha africana]|uniref:quinon protein alcohol dehydrogenase-like superfamily n=1 Tax=Mycotypha africana TaxID=64632 RepID=UPI00230017FB|nr:quinon protein alcohol dehydrogenase-like superfamily [Mycotypha africana]KAI8973321.1 quinon protein alcohol dehydrogenase-like superfamily [Mycotypha africana]